MRANPLLSSWFESQKEVAYYDVEVFLLDTMFFLNYVTSINTPKYQ